MSLPGNCCARPATFTSEPRINARPAAPSPVPRKLRLAAAFDALLAAEGSDWCWWFGADHSSSNDAEFDAFYRKLLSEVYLALGADAPDELAAPIKRQPQKAEVHPPSGYLNVRVDGRETSYFEWMGAGIYLPEERESSMHGRARLLRQIRYGFDEDLFFVRLDVFDGVFARLQDAEFRVTLRGDEELRLVIRLEQAKITGYLVETKDYCLLAPDDMVKVACERILEISVSRKLLRLGGRSSFSLAVALWEGGLPVDLLPAEGWLEVRLGADHFAWRLDAEK